MCNPETWDSDKLQLIDCSLNHAFRLGVLLAGQGPTVFLARLAHASHETLRTCQKVVYPDFDTLEEAGWQPWQVG